MPEATVTLALVQFARSREALVDLVASNHPGCSWPVPIVWAGVTVGELHEDGSTRPDPLPGVEWVV